MSTQRGFTLIEIVIAVGVVATVAAAGVGLTLSSRPLAVTTAASHFDDLLDSARTTAHDFDSGATIVFAPDAYGDGVVARLYRGRPASGPMVPLHEPPLEARVTIAETNALQSVPFALTIHTNGDMTGIPGYRLGSGSTAETACPAARAFHFHFAYGAGSADRIIPCTTTVATGGTLMLASPKPASTQTPIAPSTTCAMNCAGAPTPSFPPATCPPSYTQQADMSCTASPLLVNTGQGWTSSGTLQFASAPAVAQTFAVHEDQYTQAFTISDTCGGLIASSVIGGGGIGPDSSYSVAPQSGAMSCTLTVKDALQKTATVSIAVTNTPPLIAGTCTATADTANPTTALDISCTAPSGGTGTGYAVEQFLAHQTTTVECPWSSFSCVVSGLSPRTTISFSPSFKDSSGTVLWGNDFSGTTTASGGGLTSASCLELRDWMTNNTAGGAGGSGDFPTPNPYTFADASQATAVQSGSMSTGPSGSGGTTYTYWIEWQVPNGSRYTTLDNFNSVVLVDQYPCVPGWAY